MTPRAIMQHLNLVDWKLANRLPNPGRRNDTEPAGPTGLVEIQGKDHDTVVRLTEAGLKAMRSQLGLKGNASDG
jgi:hypothetical protein